MALFNNYADKIKNASFNGASYTFPTSIEIELSTTTPVADGTNITEPSGNNYSSVTKTANTTNFPTCSNGAALSNGTAITFPVPSGSWGTITHVVLKDHSGNLIAFQALTTSKTPGSGDTVEFAAGALTIDLN
jgi:Na+-translocating ferredoxin:NAD+ oxidoreductase RnfG subunit